MKKKRTTKSKNNSNRYLKFLVWILIVILIGVTFVGLGYYLGYEEAATYSGNTPKHQVVAQCNSTKELNNTLLSEQNATLSEEEIKERLKTVLKEQENKYAQVGASHEYEESPEQIAKPIDKSVEPPLIQQAEIKQPEEPVVKEIKPEQKTPKEKLLNKPVIQEVSKKESYFGKPKLAIIIDDVSFERDVKAVKSLHLNVTMSFLPPNRIHPESADLASREPFYMVHLPMEAMHFAGSEPITLKADDSQETISHRVDTIVTLFPRVHYINNHTGSKFTSNKSAVIKLINALSAHNITFVDSRTIGATKVPEVMRSEGKRYIGRDVFLDHTMDVAYVKGQIREAVKVAKSRGYAIAIGHPHPNTIEALRESKDILNQVDLVQINKI